MAYFFGLILVLFFSTSYADTMPASPGWVVTGNATVYGSPADACSGMAPNSCFSSNTVVFEFGYQKCYGYVTSSCAAAFGVSAGALYSRGVNAVQTGYSCPSNQGWTLSGQNCTRPDCAVGQTRNQAGQCVTDCAALKSKTYYGCVQSPWLYPGGGYPSLSSNSGCQAKAASIQAGYKFTDTNAEAWCGEWKYSGEPSTTEPASVSPQQEINVPSSCPPGQARGEVNGASVCVGVSQPAAASQDKTVVAPDGSKVVTSTTNYYNPVTNTTTTTTTITSYAPDGSQTGQTTDEATTEGDDPTRPGSSHGGTACGDNAPACKGDAIQCAQAEILWLMRCEKAPTYQAYEDSLDPARIQQDTDALDKGEHDLSAALAVTDRFAGGCIADQVVALPHGQQMTIPFSRLCPYLDVMGNVLMIIASIISIRIVGAT